MAAAAQIMLLSAPAAGVLRFTAAAGTALTAGQRVATLELDDPERVARSVPFEGVFPRTTEPAAVPQGARQRFQTALAAAKSLLDGFARAPDAVAADLKSALADPRLPAALWEDEWTSLAPLVPPALAEAVATAADTAVGDIPAALPAGALLHAIERHIAAVPIAQQRALDSACAGAVAMLHEWRGGSDGFAAAVAGRLLDRFLRSEAPFLAASDAAGEAEAVDRLRVEHSEDLQQVLPPSALFLPPSLLFCSPSLPASSLSLEDMQHVLLGAA